MAEPEWTEHSLGELSEIRVRFLSTGVRPYGGVLVARYSGQYRSGSAGNPDARYMYAMAVAGIAAFDAVGIIYDLSDLAYDWGDLLELVFGAGQERESLRMAIVVGPRCEEAVRTLLFGEKSTEPIEHASYVFRDLAAAYEHVTTGA